MEPLKVRGSGQGGFNWSSSANADTTAYEFTFGDTNSYFYPMHISSHYYGYSVRCVAR